MAVEAFDYVIIGSGATGSVIANRLSADPGNRVLVLEAGEPDTDPRIAAIGRLVEMWGSELDWKVVTEDQQGLNGRQVLINQGKVVGGSTSIHAMMYVRGNRRNFDAWRDLGNAGWGFEDVLPYFKKGENFIGDPSAYRGVGGPLDVRVNPDPASRSEPFMEAARELGYDGPHWDYNGERQEDGAGLLQFTIDREGRRASAATAFLAPVMNRPNFTLRTRCEAHKLLFEGSRATGVQYRQHDEVKHVYAEKEVIVSAGTFMSPRLLMLSGIGPADHLASHGLQVRLDAPGVGQNLQDHLQLPFAFRSNVNAEMPELLTGNVLFVRTADGDGPPDLQLNFTPSVPKPLAGVIDLGGPGFIFLPILIQPASKGELRLRSADPDDLPMVDPRYLAERRDVEVFLEAARIIRELVGTRALGEVAGGELLPGNDADMVDFIRSQASTLWHGAGTCKMGTDDMAVVDPQLRVRGIQSLRVADASVMPVVTSGNTQAPCFMIGEKAADMILGSQ